MRVLGIDPGPTESAYCLWDGKSILEKGKVTNDVMLLYVSQLVMLIDTWLGIEMIASYGMPVGAETFETCVIIGRLMEASRAPLSVTRVTRKEVCKHICNDGRAKDPQIRQRLLDLVGPQLIYETIQNVGAKGQPLKARCITKPGPTFGVSKDIWSALAVAITVYDQLQEGTYDKTGS